MTTKFKRAAASAVALGVAATVLTGCAGSGGETFTILQYEPNTTAQYKGWQLALEMFREAHPDVEVEFATTSFEAVRANSRILLTGDDVPDVMLINTGNADAGQLAAQGLVMPLTDVAHERGWDQKITGAVRALALYDEDGLAGSGDWFGVPNVASFITMYYNAEMLAEHGFDGQPATMDELEGMFQAFLDAGITPVSSNAGEHAVLHTWWQLVSAAADRQEIDDFIFGSGNPDLTSGPFLEGTERLQRWIEAGWLGSQLAGVRSDAMERAFISGEAPFMATGTWAFARLQDEADFEWGMFTFPESNLNAGASGHLWAVPTNSRNAELAFDWIELTLSPEVQNEIARHGGIPVAGDPAAIEDPQMRAMNEQFEAIKARDGLTFYPDFPVPGFLAAQMSGLQAMTNGTLDAAGFLADMQAFYDAGR